MRDRERDPSSSTTTSTAWLFCASDDSDEGEYPRVVTQNDALSEASRPTNNPLI